MKYKYFVYQIIVVGRKMVKPFFLLADKIRGLDFYADYREKSVEELGGYAYEATKFRCKISLKKFFRAHSVPGRNIMDVGCGKGYMLYYFRKSGLFHNVAGLEVSHTLAGIARNNMKRLHLDCTVYEADASVFNKYDSFDVFYLYNPFGEEVLRRFLEKLNESFIREKRQITVIYYNPVHAPVLKEYGFTDMTETYGIHTFLSPEILGLNIYEK